VSADFNPNAWKLPADFDPQAWQRDAILRKAEKDPHYAPYCAQCANRMRRKRLVRMQVVERHYWRCHCGAQCDYRQPEAERGESP
jgi:hypothetical protein